MTTINLLVKAIFSHLLLGEFSSLLYIYIYMSGKSSDRRRIKSLSGRSTVFHLAMDHLCIFVCRLFGWE